MKRKLIMILVFAVFALIAYASAPKPKSEEAGSMMMSSSEEEGTGAMMSDVVKPAVGNKIDFKDLKSARMLAEKGPVVLFFYATWCPTCNAAMKDIDKDPGRLGDVTVVIVNYDKERDLKAKYKITYQHTFVQIDNQGNPLAVWNGGGVDEILKHVVHTMEG